MKIFHWFTYPLFLWFLNDSYCQGTSDLVQKEIRNDSSVQLANDSILTETIRNNKYEEEKILKSEKITLGVISIVGGLALSLVGVLDKTFPVENCSDSNEGISGCPIDDKATERKNTRGNIFLTTGLGMVGLGIFALLWAQ